MAAASAISGEEVFNGILYGVTRKTKTAIIFLAHSRKLWATSRLSVGLKNTTPIS